jgi:hypothetical protein
MKQALLIAVLMLCLVGVAKSQDPNALPVLAPDAKGLTAWANITDNATSIFAMRLGWEEDELEFGGTAKWFTADPEWELTPDLVGGYLIFYLTQQGKIADRLPDNIFETWIHELGARPYGGLELLTATSPDSHRTNVTWLAGTLFSTDPKYATALSVEYQNTPEEDVIAFGIKHRF